jgi:hypothetical protein
MKNYVVRQPFRGVATYLVSAESGKEALAKVNDYKQEKDGVECVDRDATWIGKAVTVRLEKPMVRRK